MADYQENVSNCLPFYNLTDREFHALVGSWPLENIFKLKIGALVHKIQYQKQDTPPALYGSVQPASTVHKARFSVVASQTWEAAPMKIKCLPLNSFKKENKLLLLDSQAS